MWSDAWSIGVFPGSSASDLGGALAAARQQQVLGGAEQQRQPQRRAQVVVRQRHRPASPSMRCPAARPPSRAKRGGALSPAQAQRQRALLVEEAQRAGALDGGLRLLRGDVIVGLLALALALVLCSWQAASTGSSLGGSAQPGLLESGGRSVRDGVRAWPSPRGGGRCSSSM